MIWKGRATEELRVEVQSEWVDGECYGSGRHESNPWPLARLSLFKSDDMSAAAGLVGRSTQWVCSSAAISPWELCIWSTCSPSSLDSE